MKLSVPHQQPSPVQQVVLATSLVGAAVVFTLLERPPGWQAYLASGLLALAFLVAALTSWRWSIRLGVLALAALLIAMFWELDRPVSLATGFVLAGLSAWRAYGRLRHGEEPGKVFAPFGSAATGPGDGYLP